MKEGTAADCGPCGCANPPAGHYGTTAAQVLLCLTGNSALVSGPDWNSSEGKATKQSYDQWIQYASPPFSHMTACARLDGTFWFAWDGV